MKKSKAIIIGSITILFFLIIFLGIIFSGKKSININMQNETYYQKEDSENQQVQISDGQPVLDQHPDAAANAVEQKPFDIKQNSDLDQNNLQSDKENENSSAKIVSKFISWGFQKSNNRKIDTIIIHSAYDAIGNDPYSIDGIIAEYKQYGVSAHYLVGRDGTIYHLVADQDIAYHAGVSKMPDGRADVNNFSIGIEMANTNEDKFTRDQYAAVNQLIVSLGKKYPIKNILGHSDIAPGRKTDPWNIDWSKVNR